MWMFSAVLLVGLYLWTAVSLASVFRKAGGDPRLAWVPFANIVALVRLGGAPSGLSLLALVPVIGWGVLLSSYARVSRAFGYGTAWAVLAFVLLPAWASMLAFSSARWLGVGARPHGAAAPAHGAARADAAVAAGAAHADSSSAQPERDAHILLPPVARSTYTPPSARDDHADATSPRLAPSSTSILPSETPWQPPEPAEPFPSYAPRAMRSTYEPSDGTFDTAAEVSAVAGAPTRGAPHSALTSVPAQQAGVDAPDAASPYAEPQAADFRDPQHDQHGRDDRAGGVAAHHDVDETAIGSRRRAAWLLTPAAGRAVAITADVLILGRSPVEDGKFPTAQLVTILDDTRTMSKTHALLELRDDVWMIVDLDSTNGVVLLHEDGSEIEATPGVAVPVGERFLLGDAEMLLTRSLPA